MSRIPMPTTCPIGTSSAVRHQLVIPYTLDANDMRFATPQGFNAGDQFLSYLKDSFDTLYAEGEAGSPKMMSIGLHCRLVGRPGRVAALAGSSTTCKATDKVWLARRIDIARHWAEHQPYEAPETRPSALDEEAFVMRFGGVFEHSDWIARRAFGSELSAANDTAIGLHAGADRPYFAVLPKRTARRVECPPGSRRQTGSGQAPDGKLNPGAGVRWPRCPDRQ